MPKKINHRRHKTVAEIGQPVDKTKEADTASKTMGNNMDDKPGNTSREAHTASQLSWNRRWEAS